MGIWRGCSEGDSELDSSMENIVDSFSDDFGYVQQQESSVTCNKCCYKAQPIIFKDVVSPDVYALDSNLSIHKFFVDFEHYFLLKYYDHDRDRCRMLGKFLAGEIKQVYDVLGGCHLGYFLVKDKLLNWYDSQKYVQKHKKKCEFYNAKLKDGESLTLYCMRLEVLADLAYPNDKSKAFKKL